MKQKILNLTLLLFCMIVGIGSAWGEDVTWIASAQGYENGQSVNSVTVSSSIKISFDNSQNSNSTKYYTTGEAIRVYGGNSFTVTSSGEKITKIVFTFGTGDGKNEITANPGSLTNGTWTSTGTNSVKFTISGSTGHRRINSITVTYGSDTPAPATHTITFGSHEYGSFTATVDGNTITSGASVEEGKTVVLTANADQGYEFSYWNAYKTGEQYYSVKIDGTNSFTMPKHDVTIDAYFTESTPVTLSFVELSGTPTKTSYKVGEKFDTSGLTVTAKYSDNTSRDVTSSAIWEIDPEVLTVVGTEVVVTVIATYDGKEDIQEYSVTVEAQEEPTPSTGIYYLKITSQSDIKGGETYLIVCESENTAMGSQNTNRRNNASVTIKNDIITPDEVNVEGYPYEVTLTDESGLFTMVLSNGKYLGNGSKSDNYLKEVNSISRGYCWSLTYSGGSVTMRTNHADNPRYLCVNTSITDDSYATYTNIGSYKKVTLYKKVAPTTAIITLSAACTDGKLVYGTYSNSSAFVVPKDLTVSEISIKDNTLTVESYSTGDVVPANTGVMVSALEGGDYTVTLSSEAGESVLGEKNNLHPSSEAMTGDNLFYRLTMHNGTQIGYWWGAAEGAAFSLAANKAYLAVPKEKSVKANLWFGGAETSISAPEALNAENGVIYNLNGQRVSSATKGIYIKNGKKYFVK